MTNRKDMIDEALLRPGRLEVHMEISLPDEHGRLQILKIHTSDLTKNGHLDPDVNLGEMAHRSKNFSGAEINGLIRSATSWALNRHVKGGTMAQISDDVESVTVKNADFEHAFEEVKPAFGVSEDELQDCLIQGIMQYSPFIDNILQEGSLIVKQVADVTPLYTAVLHGPPGSGKTALAAKIALDSGYPFVKLLSPNNMVGYNESMKIAHIQRVFEDAYKSPLSVIVIDNIERILSWSSIGPRFENGVLQALMILLKKLPPTGRRLCCLATTGERSIMQQLDVWAYFDSDIAVPTVGSYEELAYVMQESGAFNNSDLQRSIQELQGLTNGSDRVHVGVKRILKGIETAQQDPDDMPGRFASVMAKAMVESAI